MELPERAQAQEIGVTSASDSGPPTIGSTGTTTSTGSLTPPPAAPKPQPQGPIFGNPLFTPGLAYGGGVSQSGETLAQEMQLEAANQTYNMKVGPVKLRADASVSTSFNDNIGLTKDNRVADITVIPFAELHGSWPVSELNSLNFDLGLGYQVYLLHSQYNSLLIAPDSALSFNFFAGDVAFNLRDVFSYEQDPTQVGQLSNQVRLERFLNDAGASATWDLGQVSFDLSYDHNNLWVTDSIYDYLTNQSDTLAPTFTYKIDETISAGINGSFSNTTYQQSFENNNTSESLGPFVKAELSDKLSVSAAAGGFLTQYASGGGNGDNSNLESYYANFGINHRINDVLTESLTGGKSYLPGLTSNYTQQLYLNYGDTWNAAKTITLSSQLSYQNLSDSNAIVRENSNIYSLSLNLQDALSQSLILNVGYQFLLKDATPSFLSYYQNLGTLGLQYNF